MHQAEEQPKPNPLKKEKEVSSPLQQTPGEQEEPPDPPMSAIEIYQALAAHPVIRAIYPTLQQGKRREDILFTIHSGLIIKMRNAYRSEDSQSFTEVIKEYLEHAALGPQRLPGATAASRIPYMQEELTKLMDLYGFKPVAEYLLSVETRPQ